jgi:hypothetical protein
VNSLVVELPPMSRVRTCLSEVSYVACALVQNNLPVSNDLVDRLRDAVGVVVETNVAQHHGGRQDQGSGVGLVLALDVKTDVTAAGLEEGDVAAHVASGNDTGATDETSADVGEDASVQVGHDHDVELLGARDALHRGVVDNHVVGLEGRVVLANALDRVAEETVSQLHDVGLVDAGDLLAVVGKGKGEGELGNALRLLAGDDLERLDDAVDRLVLEAGVLALGVLTDDAEVDVLVARLVAGDVLEQDNRGVDVELLAQGDVEGTVAGALDGRVEDTLETELVALERGNRLAEELLGVDVARLDTGDVDLLPLDGDVVGLEDLLDRLGNLGTDTVTGDQRDRVLAAELGGLEDVLADRGHGASSRERGGASCRPRAPQERLQRALASGLCQHQWPRGRCGRTWAVRWEVLDSIVGFGGAERVVGEVEVDIGLCREQAELPAKRNQACWTLAAAGL